MTDKWKNQEDRSPPQEGLRQRKKETRVFSAIKQMKPAISILLISALTIWIATRIAGQASQVDWSRVTFSIPHILTCCAVLFAAYTIRASMWALLLRQCGESAPFFSSWRVYLGSQMGRYLPGKIWQFAGAGILAKHYKLPVGDVVVASINSVLIQHLAGTALAMLALGQFTETSTIPIAISALVLSLGVFFFLTPWFSKMLRLLSRLSKREELTKIKPLPIRTILVVMPGYFLTWIGFGCTVALFTQGLIPDQTAISVPYAIGSMAAASVAGYAVLIAPSGFGVREAVLITLLSPQIGFTLAGMVAIGVRVLMTTVELLLALWGIGPFIYKGRMGAEKDG